MKNLRIIHSIGLITLQLLLGRTAVCGQERFTSPVEASGFKAPTSYDSLQAFLHNRLLPPTVHVEQIALTKQGRAVNVVSISSTSLFGSDTSKLRVLLFAQQHGDEPSGKEALTLLIARFASGEMEEILHNVDLLIVPQMNPDGAELGQRRTSDSLDLNRNHVLLTSPETRALHDLFYRWMPQVTVDMHEYGSFSSSWSDSGFIKAGDVHIGMLTNLNTSPAVRDLQHNGMFPLIMERLHDRGFSGNEYIVGSPGDRLRHSTTEINDGRQSFGILGTVSFIQEGRKWHSLEEQLRRRALSQLTSIEAILEYSSQHAREIRTIVDRERHRLSARVGQPVAVRMDHYPGSQKMTIPVQLLPSGRDSTWQVHPYHGEVRLIQDVRAPEAYLIRKSDTSIVALLSRHHVRLDTIHSDRELVAESYLIDSVRLAELEEDTIPFLSVRSYQASVSGHPGDFIVPTGQLQSMLVTILLEPASVWGLTKYPSFDALLRGQRYPIVRIGK